jgi:hypothetical protein
MFPAARPMSYYIRYFAESPVTIKGLATAIKATDPQYKIDGGDLMCGADVVAEVGVDSAGSDLFVEELSARIAGLEQVASEGAQYAIRRLRGVQSIVAIRVDPAVAWDMLRPLWTVLPSVSTGLTQVDGQGYYDGSQLVVGIA